MADRDATDEQSPGSSRTVVIDFNLDDSWRSIRQFLTRLGSIVTEPSHGPWTLDLTQARYIGPDAAAVIAACVLDARRCGHQAAVLLPENPPQLAAFCKYAGLRHLLLGEPLPDPDDPRSETVPIMRFEQCHYYASSAVNQLIRRHVQMTTPAEEYLRICFNEVVQNVEDHALSPVGAIACAKFMRQSSEVRVAIADRGRGIFRTLRDRHPAITNSVEAMSRVIRGGISAQSKANNLGLGISNLCAIVQEQMQGSIFIISGDVLYCGAPRPDIQMLATPYQGTVACFTLKVNVV
jgi:hypothetical protein